MHLVILTFFIFSDFAFFFNPIKSFVQVLNFPVFDFEPKLILKTFKADTKVILVIFRLKGSGPVFQGSKILL